MSQTLQPEVDMLRRKSSYRPPIVPLCKGDYCLTATDAINLAVIFEDLCDQLNIISNNIDWPYTEVRSKKSFQNEIMETHRRLSQYSATDQEFFQTAPYVFGPLYESCIPRKIMEMNRDKANESLKTCTSSSVFEKAIRADKLTEAYLRQKDLHFIQQAAHNVVEELVQNCSFMTLKETFDQEKCKKRALLKKFREHNELSSRIANLKRNIAHVKEDQRKESCRLNGLITYYTNETLEVQERSLLEIKFMENTASMKVVQSRKYWVKQDKECEAQRDELLNIIDKEMNRSSSMMEIIKSRIKSSRELLSHWIDKYDTERDMLIAELEMLKDQRQRGLYRMEELNILTGNYMPIVEDDRRVKTISQARKAAQEDRHKKATRIQAWWRGTLVRRQMGPYHPRRAIDKRPVLRIPKIDLSALIMPKPTSTKASKSLAAFTKSVIEVNKKFKKSELSLNPSEVFLNLRQFAEQEEGGGDEARKEPPPPLEELQEVEEEVKAENEAARQEESKTLVGAYQSDSKSKHLTPTSASLPLDKSRNSNRK